MKINSINIENVLGAKSVSIFTDKPALLVAGANGAGKSSIAEAIRQAVTGEVSRVSLKKEYPALLTSGAKTGSVAVEFDGFTATLALPAGTNTASGQVPKHIDFCLDPHRFVALDGKERRTFLFGLMGVKMTAATIKEKLTKRGVQADKAEQVTPLLAAGFDAAHKESQAKARDAKAAWRAITGETYGSQKAEGWSAEAPVVEGLAKIAAPDVTQLSTEIEDKSQELGRLRAVVYAQETSARDLEATRTTAATFARLSEKLKIDRAELATWVEKLAETKAKASGEDAAHPLTCPHCSGLLVLNQRAAGTELQAYEPPAKRKDAEAAAKLPEYQKAHDLLARAVANDEKSLAAADAAAKKLAELEQDAPEQVSKEQIDALTAEIAALKDKRDKAQAAHQAARDAQQKAAQAAEKTKKATSHHEDVKAWEAISDALAPDGIPSEFLADAMEPFNASLLELSGLAGWATVEVDSEMQITVGKRAYALRSESEKWRTDAIIAAAIAKISRINFVMLDRFDVLDGSGRSEALGWLADLGMDGFGSLTFGTLKSVPAGLPEEFDGVWIEGGVAELQPHAVAQ
jgi:AAA domain